MENDSKFQAYANEIVREVPQEDIIYLITLFVKEAAINMGSDVDKETLDRIIFYIKRDYSYIPINYVASAFLKGSLGQIGDGKGRLIPKTIHGWLGDISLEYNRMVAARKQKERESDVSIAMNLHKYPMGKAIRKKIDWLKAGSITIDEWEKIPLQEIAEAIGKGHEPKITDFK
jgi:hypothetical protein